MLAQIQNYFKLVGNQFSKLVYQVPFAKILKTTQVLQCRVAPTIRVAFGRGTSSQTSRPLPLVRQSPGQGLGAPRPLLTVGVSPVGAEAGRLRRRPVRGRTNVEQDRHLRIRSCYLILNNT